MDNDKNIVSGILKYSVSTWMNLLCGFSSVIITTRLLPPNVYGQIAIFESFTTVLIYVLALGMDAALIRFYNEPPKGNTINQLLYKNFVFSFICCLTFGCVITLWGGEVLSDFIFDYKSRILICIVFIYAFNKIILRYLSIAYRMSFQAKKYTIQDVLFNNLTRLLIIVSVFFTTNFLNIIKIIVCGYLIIFFFYLYVQRRSYLPYDVNHNLVYSISYRNFKNYFKYALFSAPTYLVHFLNNYFGQQIIKTSINSFALGVYASTNMFSSILMAVKGGFSTYWSAYIFKNYNNDNNRIRKMHDYVVLLSIMSISILICMRDVIYLIIGKNFHDSKHFFSLLLVMPIMSFIMETTDKGIYIRKKNHISLYSHIASVGLNLLGCMFLLPLLGLLGAAIANAISAIVLFLINTLWGQKYYESIDSKTRSIVGILFLIMLTVLPVLTNSIQIIWLFTLFIVLMTLYIYKKQVKELYLLTFRYIR